MILLDTNVCIRILRGQKDALRMFAKHAGDVAIPAMVTGELYYGAEKSSDPLKSRVIARRFIDVVPVMQTTDSIMSKFGECKAKLAAKGQIVEDADILIAATALTSGCPLATGNVRHFERFEGLEVQDWTSQDFREEKTK